MPRAKYQLPSGFLWGTATAAHQVEGNNTNNNWWQWEQTPGNILNGDKSGLACDWWGGRWEEDFDRVANTHQNAHRFSIEWSRIQPSPSRWDDNAIDVYREMLKGLIKRNMVPMVTLHHFTDPIWFNEQGGWENEKSVECFIKFTRKVVKAFKDYVHLWVTINEPNVYLFGGYMHGGFPPGYNSLVRAFRAGVNLLKAHAGSYHAIHKLQSDALVGMAHNYRSIKPAHNWCLPESFLARQLKRNFHTFAYAAQNGVFSLLTTRKRVPAASNTQDFIGVNYYSQDIVSFDIRNPSTLFGRLHYPDGSDLSGSGFIANVPDGMFEALHWALHFNRPIYVTENGVEDAEDKMRPRYITQHIHKIWRAVNFNWPIKGYFHWSLVDNFEWERGWSQRFGLWGLDVATQKRIRRPSVDLYASICKENALSSDLVQKYAPEAFESIFPG
ncbi:MAG: glycoside hydrolase family 1 protein [Anaerolineaceae bacterium]|nr:glycoside hydrolase family 1 protein [Anaerolineaceae bacterium]